MMTRARSLGERPRTSARPYREAVNYIFFCCSRAIGETYLLGNNNIQIVLGLVNVRAHRDDAADTGGIGLAGAGARGVHDRVLGGAEEISGSTKTV